MAKRNTTAMRCVSMPGKKYAAHPAMISARVGYLSARAGEPFNPDAYASEKEQAAYEAGRLWALNMKASGVTAPPWRVGCAPGPALDASLNLSLALCGGCQPGEGDGQDYLMARARSRAAQST